LSSSPQANEGGAEALDETKKGLLFALGAYGIWGIAPIYFVWVGFAGPFEILANRIVWAIPLLLVLLGVTKQWAGVWTLTKSQLAILVVTAIALSINWLTFISAIQAEKIAEASLGYYINPLVNVILGWLFLQERMRPLQWLAIGLAAFGVGTELVVQASVPWLGLTLAMSFGVYGLLRKKVNLPAVVGLFVETMLVLPIALGYLILLYLDQGTRTIFDGASLALGGVITVIPLVFFAAAATRLPLTTLGFVQYLAPTITLLLAIFLYDETVPAIRWFTFSMIWLAVVIFSLENLYQYRKRRLGDGK
jgi:chloramphenicol-sensitive protein RarD|tara:strand:+ start:15185 stop:16105 length:921 start_codon:yes stop_codon:yes gene_type:complete